MDRTESMAMSGSPPFYMQRGMSELHDQNMHSMSNPGMQFQPNTGGSSSSAPAVVIEPTSTVLPDGLSVGASSMQPPIMPMRRKRGRPRKYGPGGRVSLSLVASTASHGMNSSSEKRSRGRPPGSGRKQQSTTPGEVVSGSAGVGFTPHVITVATGEDISAKIMAFSQQRSRAVCILSANGSVSTVTLQQSPTSSGTVTYEGRFDILCLSGSFVLVGDDNFHNRSGGLNILLASADGRVLGGGVGGMLIAASPVQVIVGTFTWAASATKPKTGNKSENVADSEHFSVDSTMANAPSGHQSQNLSSASSIGAWANPQVMDMRNSQGDIDLMRS